MRPSWKLAALGAVLVLVLNAPAAPAADKEQVLKDRAALMKEQGAALGAVKGFIDGKNDLAKAEQGAGELTKTIAKIPEVFPAGTDGPAPDGKYATKATVWSDAKDFQAARETAATKAQALVVAVKGGDKAKIEEAFADMGKNGCGGCHGKFREEIKK